MSPHRSLLHRLRTGLALLWLARAPLAFTAVPRDFAIDLKATVSDSAPHLSLSWTQRVQSNISAQRIHRRLKGQTTWTKLADLTTTQTSYVDTTALPNVEYEYWMERTLTGLTPNVAMGYLSAGVKVPAVQERGTLLLVVDDTVLAPLAPEIAELKLDLLGDGWNVQQITAARTSTATAVKALIAAAYNADPANVKAVYLLGRVPVPYSGNQAPDGHGDHVGAWPADGYYGDLDGTWTDTSVNTTTAARTQNRNIPGDGKFDQVTFPSLVELQVGRVDLHTLTRSPASSVTEVSRLRRYLRRAHQYRHKLAAYAAIPRRTLIRDGFGHAFTSEPFAVTAWMGAFACVGQPPEAPIDEAPSGQWFSATYAGGRDYLWGHGCGGGSYESAGSFGTTVDIGHRPSRVVFTSLFGSYHGDWDADNNLMRTMIAGNPNGDSLALTCFWAGRPHWFPHHPGMGETMGYMTRASMNAGLTGGGAYVPGGSSFRGVHIGLLGDPALRMHAVEPPRRLAARSSNFQVTLSWAPSTEPAVEGYFVYRADSPDGPLANLTPGGTTGTTFIDGAAAAGLTYTYLVRTLKLESVPGGSYYNLSVGSPVTITASAAATSLPANPSELSVDVPGSASSVHLSWQDNASDETGFRVERRVNAAGAWTTVATLPANATSHTDSGPFNSGSAYYYRVFATGTTGESPASNVAATDALAGFLEFTNTKMKVSKTAGSATIPVTRFGGSVGTISVTYATSNSSALAGTHFTTTTGTLTWADGDTADKQIVVPITNTAAPQLPRQFKVTLSAPTGGAAIGQWVNIAVQIEDPAATLNSPWTSTMLGTVTDQSPAASAEGVLGDSLIGGSGLSSGATSEAGRFIYQTLTGDGVMTMQVPTPTPAQGNARFALMVRGSTSASAISAAAAVASAAANYGTKLAYRLGPAAPTTLTPSADNNLDTPQWLRLTRAGDIFTAESSADGTTWTNLGSIALTSMPTTALWGIFHCAADWASSSTYLADFQLATYQNVSLASLPAPASPGAFAIGTVTNAAVALSWGPTPGAAGYRIERRGDDGSLDIVADRPGTSSSHSDTAITPDVAYEYRIAAYNGAGSSAWSAALRTVVPPAGAGSPPRRPGFLNVTPGAGTSLVLSWADFGTDETGFRIERRVAHGDWTLLQTTAANATSHTDATPLAGVLYDYRVRAETAAGPSAWATVPAVTRSAWASITGAIFSANGSTFQRATALPQSSYVPTGMTFYTPAANFVTSVTLSTSALRNNFNGWVGMGITTGASPIVVREVGRWVVSGNAQAHAVKLVHAATSTDVPGGSAVVNTAGQPVGFAYAPLAVPVTLAANTAYFLASQETSGGDQWYEGNNTLTSPAAVATVNQAASSTNGTAFSVAFSTNNSYGPVNFRYSAAASPLVSSHAMTRLRNDYSGWLGHEFTTGGTVLTVSQLGRWVVAGNTGTHTVRLIDAAGGTTLASVNVPTAGAPAGQFRYVALPAVLTLSAHTAYFLLSQETAGGDQWLDFGQAAPGSATGYQQWLLANGLPMDASGRGAATAEPVHDRLPNLVKYALGLSPNSVGHQGRLAHRRVTDSGQEYLAFSYTRPEPAPAGVSYAVEASGTLGAGSWSGAGLVQVGSTVNAGLRTITVRDGAPLAPGTMRFLRLSVAQP